MPTAKPDPSLYQLKITLLEITRPIWRRVEVPGSIRLSKLHDVFQAVMGWTDSHLHQFDKGEQHYAVPDPEFEDDIKIIDDSRVPLYNVLMAQGDSMIYRYDFGDNWRHEVILEKILPLNSSSSSRPVCLAGERRCPPEDVGGPHGYDEFLKVIFEPGHEEFGQLRTWSGGTFHAEEFDLEAVNRLLENIRLPVSRRK